MAVMLSRTKTVISLSLAFSTSTLVGGSGAESSLLITPVVMQGDLLPARHLQTTFRVVNLVDRQITLRIEGLNDDGVVERIFCPGPVVGGPERTLMLPANGVVNLGSGGNTFNGWARITSEERLTESVQVTAEVSVIEGASMPCPPVICTRPSDEVFSSIQLRAVEPAKRFRSQATIASHRESAFAIVNPSAAEQAQIQILARDRNDRVFDANELTLAPGARVSLLLWQLLLLNKVFIVAPERPDNFHGSLGNQQRRSCGCSRNPRASAGGQAGESAGADRSCPRIDCRRESIRLQAGGRLFPLRLLLLFLFSISPVFLHPG